MVYTQAVYVKRKKERGTIYEEKISNGSFCHDTAFDWMRAGDALAKELVDRFIEYVACGLTNVINVFQPEIICIGGGVSREGETLLAPLRKLVDEEDYARNSEHRTKIVVAQLHNDAGIIGAASLGSQNNE